MELKEKAAYLKGLVEGLGIDETTKEGKVIKAMSELLCEMAQAVDGIDEDVTQAYDQINDLSEELEDLEADLYEDDDADEEDDEPEQAEFPPPKRRCEPRLGFWTLLGAALLGAPGDDGHGGRCTGDCAHCPPHFGYRYGRWYYGHGHVYGCEFG